MSNESHGPFYDPQYTMAITINGQLLLCMLAERLMMTVPGLEMIQINTDGLTVRVPRRLEWLINDACAWWQRATGLALEESRYQLMHVRDVNNYVAWGVDGKIKTKGAYECALPQHRNPLGWHQDTSALAVPLAAVVSITKGEDVEHWIRGNENAFDFMLRAKANRGSSLVHGERQVQATTRYYVSTDGAPLTKISPPPAGCRVGHYKKANGVSDRAYHATDNTVWTAAIHTKNRSTHKERRTSINAGYLTTVCNRASDFRWENVNYDWYISEAQKLLTT
jgi:alkylated DNA repair dioxygenase AlkB